MDMIHTVLLEARRDELHRARIESTNDKRILDLGTGTGTAPLPCSAKRLSCLQITLGCGGVGAPADTNTTGIWALDMAE